MKSLRFAILLICVFAAVGFTQQPSAATKIDEFYGMNCEAQRGDLDILLSELKNSPETHGVIVIHGEPNDPVTPYKQKLTIINHLKIRRFDMARIHIHLGESEARFRTELWKSPPYEIKRFVSAPWNYKLADFDGPILMHAQSWIDGIGCGAFTPDLNFFSAFLRANRDLIGRVVIRDTSIRGYNRARSNTIGELRSKYGVSANKLEFAFLKGDWSDIEFWYVPSGIFQQP